MCSWFSLTNPLSFLFPFKFVFNSTRLISSLSLEVVVCDGRFAKGTRVVGGEPARDALVVENVACVARQSHDLVVRLVLYIANHALLHAVCPFIFQVLRIELALLEVSEQIGACAFPAIILLASVELDQRWHQVRHNGRHAATLAHGRIPEHHHDEHSRGQLG